MLFFKLSISLLAPLTALAVPVPSGADASQGTPQNVMTIPVETMTLPQMTQTDFLSHSSASQYRRTFNTPTPCPLPGVPVDDHDSDDNDNDNDNDDGYSSVPNTVTLPGAIPLGISYVTNTATLPGAYAVGYSDVPNVVTLPDAYTLGLSYVPAPTSPPASTSSSEVLPSSSTTSTVDFNPLPVQPPSPQHQVN